MFPSLKKYVSCRMNESSAASLTFVEKFVRLAPKSAGFTLVASVVIMCVSETIESIETTETELELDRDGETRGSIQDTIRGDMREGDVGSLSYRFPLFMCVCKVMTPVTSYTRRSRSRAASVRRAQFSTLISTHALRMNLTPSIVDESRRVKFESIPALRQIKRKLIEKSRR